ncbi:ABC transporter ATP-binding protein [Lysinibacillus endophyticus]|uniref:ABC transporter ATP-binding protein n=1 Tax=Ureibacillus endophyticus TaxID=1978490 RepID=A0A494YY97_9BACL|nr:ABC transporter ATP-binding protein [Lysinibacillus endophyticus]MCP1144719.1 ABC transporter ATP-binding protein [Lysinibacillus endophyticus]RKQ14686.1 ABC transporter ATP-binding protein [Lysinibacillus endophyticus]
MKGVHLKQVTKSFGNVQAIKDLNLSIKPGEFFTFLGPSGCGKTTTLRMIAGFYYPTTGHIYFDEQNVTTLQPNKRNIGMVFQNYALFPHMTVDENIAFGLKVRKMPKKEIETKVNRIREIVHLGEYGHRKINELSGGQQQRVALARALVIEPDILLLDEPLSNLDAKLREETRFEIKRIQSELGVTTIYVTHDQTEAMAMSDRIMVMENGEVKQIGTPQEIYNRPVNRFVSNFIGESNTIEAKIETVSADDITVQTKDGMRLRGKKQNVSPLAQLDREQTIYVSVRPELIQYGPGENEMVGTISFVEFTGLSAHYLVKMQNFTLKVMILNDGSPLKKVGEQIMLNIPSENLYFLGE